MSGGVDLEAVRYLSLCYLIPSQGFSASREKRRALRNTGDEILICETGEPGNYNALEFLREGRARTILMMMILDLWNTISVTTTLLRRKIMILHRHPVPRAPIKKTFSHSIFPEFKQLGFFHLAQLHSCTEIFHQ